MKRGIEVVGEASYEEAVSSYNADIDISVRAAKGAVAVDEAVALRNDCISKLVASGIGQSELKEGGAETWPPWFWKRRPGQESLHKIIISCKEMDRLMKAVSALEPLFANQRYGFTLNMKRPAFDVPDDTIVATRRKAIENARDHARILAEESQLVLGGVIQIEEVKPKTEGSGVYGDESWRYDLGASALGESAEEPYARIQEATRKVAIKYRVRFEAKPTE